MRIRTIKPEFTQDEELSSLSAECHLLAGGLLCYADDDGYFNANPGLVKAAVFPVRETSVSIPVMLLELSRIEYVKFGTAPDGKRYGLIRNFSKHQVINHKKDSVIKKLQIVWDESGTTTVVLPDDSNHQTKPATEQGSTPPVTLRPEGNGREWKGMEGNGRGSGKAPP
jgi:DNA replication protein DnaT